MNDDLRTGAKTGWDLGYRAGAEAMREAAAQACAGYAANCIADNDDIKGATVADHLADYIRILPLPGAPEPEGR